MTDSDNANVERSRSSKRPRTSPPSSPNNNSTNEIPPAYYTETENEDKGDNDHDKDNQKAVNTQPNRNRDQPLQHDPSSLRTSTLSHPTMKLTGHKGSVYSLAYDPQGECLVSGSFDTTCLLWNGSGTCENFNELSGHKNAILDVRWTHDSDHIVTASADSHLGWYDANTGTRIKRLMGHDGVINAVDCCSAAGGSSSASVVVSGGDDKTARIWDARVGRRKGNVGILDHEFQVTAVAMSMDGRGIYTGGIDNCITMWDVRRLERVMKMKGHGDTITSLAIHPNGTHLLSNSMDGSLRTWDIRPFVPKGENRHCKTFLGGTHNAERGLLNCSWSKDGSMVSAGSSDRLVHIWDEMSTEELYCLGGHMGCVNAVVFHPKENHVVASGSSDNCIFVGELA